MLKKTKVTHSKRKKPGDDNNDNDKINGYMNNNHYYNIVMMTIAIVNMSRLNIHNDEKKKNP